MCHLPSIQGLMKELESREAQFISVQDKGEGLVMGRHSASKTVEAYMAAMQTQWAWLLQLTMCLETHLKHATAFQQVGHHVWGQGSRAAPEHVLCGAPCVGSGVHRVAVVVM